MILVFFVGIWCWGCDGFIEVDFVKKELGRCELGVKGKLDELFRFFCVIKRVENVLSELIIFMFRF